MVLGEEQGVICYSPDRVYAFTPGDTVFVYNDKHPFYHARILDPKTQSEPERKKYEGRFKVEYLGNKSTYWCLPKYFVKVFPLDSVQVIVCNTTHDYRRMAHSQVFETDLCLEIGCDLGECTRILGRRGLKAFGVDKAAGRVEIAKEKTKTKNQNINSKKKEREVFVEYEILDVFENPHQLEKYNMCTKVFIDINGSRMCEAVEDCLAIARSQITNAQLFVVKSRELFQKYDDIEHNKISQP